MHPARCILSAVLAVALIATPDAVGAQRSVVLTPFAGGTVFTNQPSKHSSLSRGSGPAMDITDARYQDAVTVGTFAGVHFNPRWELEALISWAPSRLEARGGLRR
jgi:hypothetical protein